MKLNKYIDHTLLKPEATTSQILALCDEALKYDFASVCVNPTHVSLCAKKLKGSDVKVCTVIGFPLGANTSAVKAFETKDAILNGAQEIDMVINIGALKEKNYDLVKNDIKAVYEAANHTLVKVIFETCLLSKEEIVKACEICMEVGVEYVKTSTGFNKYGATFEDVKLMADTVNGVCKVKAAGGIRNYEDAMKMINECHASRLGTSSGVAIVSKEN
ncbi:MAG: deoxyribose-phosphate aldolase [Erysipelotrichaceae bacterium]|nr:deoxyribose-phosphate aldolase [Erysipelotrichaceae bacterium]